MVQLNIKKIMDVSNPNSFISKLRLKRMIIFNELIADIPTPVKILDIGGTINFWEKIGFAGSEDYAITVLNVSHTKSNYPNIITVVGDARDLSIYSLNQFDVAFSNSVIEHVGDYDDKFQMAQEVQRIAKKYFVQTPNYYFPFEPHFLFPCFQFFPLWLKALLIRNFNLGHRPRCRDKVKAIESVNSVQLLRKKEVQALFPNGKVYVEKLFMMPYSIIGIKIDFNAICTVLNFILRI